MLDPPRKSEKQQEQQEQEDLIIIEDDLKITLFSKSEGALRRMKYYNTFKVLIIQSMKY